MGVKKSNKKEKQKSGSQSQPQSQSHSQSFPQNRVSTNSKKIVEDSVAIDIPPKRKFRIIKRVEKQEGEGVGETREVGVKLEIGEEGKKEVLSGGVENIGEEEVSTVSKEEGVVLRDKEEEGEKFIDKAFSEPDQIPVLEGEKGVDKGTFVESREAGDEDLISGEIIEVKTEDYYKDLRREIKKMRKPPLRKRGRRVRKEVVPQVFERHRKISIGNSILVGELSKKTGVKVSEIIKKLFELGVETPINRFIDFDTASIVAESFGFEVEKEVFDERKYLDSPEGSNGSLIPKPPVVTVMGHVDHGKTTLLDFIRRTRVVDSEAGGITQKMGAYAVEISGRFITFIDTPGHEVFTSMRARGAQVTDMVVLVVAADEGVMPQTVESINHAKAANVPIVVSINKIDKAGANPEKVKKQLAGLGLIPEDWGGDTLYEEISAKTGYRVNKLLEKILLQSDMLGMKANPSGKAEAVCIESRVDKAFGTVVTVIVKRGTLKKGDIVVIGTTYGRVRMLFNEIGKMIKEISPGLPADVVIGGSDLPRAGEKLYTVDSEEIARKIVEERKRGAIRPPEISETPSQTQISLDSLSGRDTLNIILKSDSQGTLEGFENAMLAERIPEVDIKIIHKGIGPVSSSDVELAKASHAIIFGFNTKPDRTAEEIKENVEIRTYKVIYDAIDDIKNAVRGLLKPRKIERIIGRARILKIFKIAKVGKVAGCYVEDGIIKLACPARVRRNGSVVWDGKIFSLKRFKDDVPSVDKGVECGIFLGDFSDMNENDIVECYEIEEVALR